MIVCNHPSSFFEACLMAVMLPRPLYFLTRGDFFKNRLFAWFLGQTHQVPIFRAEDGFDKLRSNKDTFGYCYAALREQKVIIIFPESRTETEKRLRPVQKGAARIALGALERIPNLDKLQILPVGITFSDPTRYRSLATLRCGELITVTPSPADEREQIAEITAQIERALKSVIIHIDDPAREQLFDAAQELMFNASDYARFPVSSTSDAFPQVEQALEKRINKLSPEQANEMRDAIDAYQAQLKRYHLKDRHLFSGPAQSLIGKLALLLLLPLILLGKLITFLPSRLVHSIINKRIRRIPFYGATKWALGMLSYGFLIIILLSLGFGFWGLPGLLVALFCVMAGYLNLQYFHDLGLAGLISLIGLSGKSRGQLLEQRSAILAFV
jgi:1-acyl-sn-glycerol-3-phosphate acyltransferase